MTPRQEQISVEKTSTMSVSDNSSSDWSVLTSSWMVVLTTISLLLLINLVLLWRWKSTSSSERESKEDVEPVAIASLAPSSVVAQADVIPIPNDPVRPTMGPRLKDYDNNLLLTPLRINRRQIQPSSSGFERGSLHSISSNNSSSNRSNSNSNSSNSGVCLSGGSSCRRFTPMPYPLMIPSSAHDTLLPFSSGGGSSRKKPGTSSSFNFEDSPCKLSLQMGLLTPPAAERALQRQLYMGTKGLLPGADADIGDLSDIYECNDVINDSATLEDGGSSLFVDPVLTDSQLDISELYKNVGGDDSTDHNSSSGGGGDDENNSTPSKQNSLAEELASFFVDDNPALEALQLRQLTDKANKMGSRRSPSSSPCSEKTPLSQNGVLSTSFNHEYIVGDDCGIQESNTLNLSQESIGILHPDSETDIRLRLSITTADDSNRDDDTSCISTSPSKNQENAGPVIHREKLYCNSPNILTVRTSSTTKYDEDVTLGGSISDDFDKENHRPSAVEDYSFEKRMRVEPQASPASMPAGSEVDENENMKTPLDGAIENNSHDDTVDVLLDAVDLKATLKQQQQPHIDCSRSCSTRSIEYMPVDRHYIDLHMSDSPTALSVDSCEDLDSVVPGFLKACASDGDDEHTISLVRRPSINKIIEIELLSYVQQQLFQKEKLNADSKRRSQELQLPLAKQATTKSGSSSLSNPKRVAPPLKQKQYGAFGSSGSSSSGSGSGSSNLESPVRRASLSALGSRSRSRSPPPLPTEKLQKPSPLKLNSISSSHSSSKGSQQQQGRSKSMLNSINGQIRRVADGVINDFSPTKTAGTSSGTRKGTSTATTTSTQALTGTTASTNDKTKKEIKFRKKS